jgi:hypothetical protein
MEAVQQMRREAWDYGYLRSNAQIRVINAGSYIEIEPANPGYIYIPQYDPRIVYVRPRSDYGLGGVISFGPRVAIGAGFAPWGWGTTRFAWPTHDVILNNRNWDRKWEDRGEHSHPYVAPRAQPGLFEERHERDRQYRNREQDNRNREADRPR